ncbi:mitochondrial ribosomal death-associated protein 3-domain-containing protein [Calycina marina]|uniref:Small ribosomal subunit protein mS29 n=1 Tax=Calycina marina TaxID=1763456 RepID=A0A9P7YZ15_9HELO|nr:mitochondrial ribosomal death-associated protein 3-domain-containing protein [Calycina marina]
MASPACWKCLSRPSPLQMTSQIQLRSATAAFSTTTPVFNVVKKKTAAGKLIQSKAGQAKTLRLKKKAPVKMGKPPAPGERKAMRKRVVLSNTNALAVPGMQDLKKDIVGNLGKEFVGRVLGIEGKTVDALRAAEAFKPHQSWCFFRRPGILIREETIVLGEKIIDAEKEGGLKLVLDGDRVTGKSLMLVSALAMAHVRGWIVLNVPEAQELTNAVTDYAAIEGSKLYSQNTYTASWLTAIAKTNAAILDKLKLTQEHPEVPIPLPADITLTRLCELGARDPEISWPILQALWKEMTANGRPPIIMALDGLQYISQDSLYRTPDFKPIHSHDLAIVDHFLAYLSGEKTFPNGGAAIAATSRSHAPTSKSMELAIRKSQERQFGGRVIERDTWGRERYDDIRAIEAFRNDENLRSIEVFAERDPWEKNYDARSDRALAKIETMKLAGLSRIEARGLMEYWAQSGLLRKQVDEKIVTEKWTLAGNGVVGEIERGALHMRI